MFTDAPLNIASRQGNHTETLIFALMDPLTLRNRLDLQAALRAQHVLRLAILDLSGVQYGLGGPGYLHCLTNGGRLVLVGINSRVMEVCRITKIDSVVPQVASGAEAESQAD